MRSSRNERHIPNWSTSKFVILRVRYRPSLSPGRKFATRMKAATSTALCKTEEKIPLNTRRRRKPGEKAATSTAMWKTEERIPPNTRWRRPGEYFINTYEETRKALEEVDANRNETDLDEETQKALDDMVSNGPSCRPDVVKEPETPKEVE